MAAIAIAAFAVAGCDAGSRDNDGTAGPPVRLLAVRGLDESGHLVVISPGSGQTVARNTTLHLEFDRFLLPTSAIRQAICVQPHEATTIDECVAPVSFSVAYDPANREVIYRLQTDQNGGNIGFMGPDYVLTLFQPSVTDPGSVGFRAFDGAILDQRTAIAINLSDKMAPASADAAPTAFDSWCDMTGGAQTVLTGNCGVEGCHVNQPSSTGVLEPAAMGLQFNVYRAKPGEIVDAIARTAINHVAHETQIGQNADNGEAAPDRFGRAMPIVDAQAAGNSYLLYKLLIGQDASGLPFIAQADERQRLRDGFVVDDPMPLSNNKPTPVQMKAEWIETISRWIQAGAEMPDCSKK